MSTGPEPGDTRPAAPMRTERAPEVVVVPPGLYTLRTIVLGAAAVVGAVGLMIFVQATPDTLPGPMEAAVRFQPGAAADGAGCGQACLGRAVAVRELDSLPMVLDTQALAVVSRAEPERPWAATPPPTARLPEAGDSDHGGGRKGNDNSGKDRDKGNKGGGEGKHNGDEDD